MTSLPARGDPAVTAAVPEARTGDHDLLQRALAGRYRVERELGRGAMGIVFLARDAALERPVAIKLLPPALAGQPEFRERFLRESRTVAGLFHPHIVPIHAVEEHDGLVFYVMGYVDGETLTARVQRVGSLPPAEVSRILQESAWALAHAHGRGIVHRDVKPDNILLERATGRVLLTDFGIARPADSTMTAIGTSLGTPQFMSPEQAAGDAIDARSDLYALGLVGYFALAGTPPFTAPTMQAVMAMQVTRPAPPVAGIRPGIPPRLAQAIDRCLAKDPGERWPSGEALVAAIRGDVEAPVEIAPQVRNFQRVSESLVIQGITMLSVIPLVSLSRPRFPLFPIVWIAVACGLLLVQVIARARLLLRDGFTQEDVRAAIDAELRRRDDEGRSITRADLDSRGAKRARVLLMLLIMLGGGMWGVAFKLISESPASSTRVSVGIALLLGGAALILGSVIAMSRTSVHLEARTARLSAKIWQGWFGRTIFTIAGRFTRPAPTAG